MSPAPTPAISLRTVRQHVARITAAVEHNGALFNEHVLPRLGTVEALTAAHRDDLLAAEERSLDAERRLWRHRADINDLKISAGELRRDIDCVNNGLATVEMELCDRLNALQAAIDLHFDSHAAMRGSLLARLRWLFTGKVC